MKRKTFPAKLANLRELLDWILTFAEEKGFNKKALFDINLSSEEICVNIIKHGFQGKEGEIEISLNYEKPELEVTFKDSAPPFNPITAKRKEGYGLLLISTYADELKYERRENHNFLYLKKLRKA